MVCWRVEIAKSCITKPKFHQMLHLARHRSTCLWLTRYDGCMWFDSWLTDSVSWTLRCWDVDNFVKDWHHLRTGWVMSRTDSRSRNLSTLTTRHWDLNSIYRRYVKTLLSCFLARKCNYHYKYISHVNVLSFLDGTFIIGHSWLQITQLLLMQSGLVLISEADV